MRLSATPEHDPVHVWHRAKLTPHTRLLLSKRPHRGGSALHLGAVHGTPFLGRHPGARGRRGPAALRQNRVSPLHGPCHESPSCVAADLAIMAMTVGVLALVAYLCNLVGGLHPHP